MFVWLRRADCRVNCAIDSDRDVGRPGERHSPVAYFDCHTRAKPVFAHGHFFRRNPDLK